MGCEESWRIGNKFFNGGTPSTQKPEYWSGNIPWITGADIVNQRIDVIRRCITKEAVNNSSTNIIEQGNLLLVTRTGVGKMTIAPFDVAISQDITGIYVNDKIDVEYLFRFFDFNSSKLRELNQGTSIAGITRETLITTLVAFPPTKSEQKAIAAVLSDIDSLIESLDRLIAKKRDIKQATMQQLLTGKTRLPGFSGKWNVKKLGEISPLQRGFDLPNSQLKEGVYPVVYSNGVLNYHSSFKVKSPGVVTGRSGTIGKVNYTEDDYWPHNTTLWVTDFQGNLPKYIYYLFMNVKLERFGTGSGVPTMNRNDVHSYQIPIPPYLEQQVIADILSDMDAEIAALEQKRDKTRALKQGIMQELLTRKTRLV